MSAEVTNQTPLQRDLGTVLDAAGNWANEIVDYIAPALSQDEREEKAKEAGALEDAITRVQASAVFTGPGPVEYAEDGSSSLATKAGYATATLSIYHTLTGGRPLDRDDVEALETAAVDLLADLAHWANLNKLDVHDLLEQAMGHVNAEAGRCFLCSAPVQLLGEQQTAPFCPTCNKED